MIAILLVAACSCRGRSGSARRCSYSSRRGLTPPGPVDARVGVQHARHRARRLLVIAAGFTLLGRWGWLLIVRTSGGRAASVAREPRLALPLLAAIGIARRRRRSPRPRHDGVAARDRAAGGRRCCDREGAAAPRRRTWRSRWSISRSTRWRCSAAIGRLLAGVDARAVTGPQAQFGGLDDRRDPAGDRRCAPLSPPRGDSRRRSTDLYAAGQWLRANVGAACVRLPGGRCRNGVLAAPRRARQSARIGANGRGRSLRSAAAMAPWITAEGRRYAIADMTATAGRGPQPRQILRSLATRR